MGIVGPLRVTLASYLLGCDRCVRETAYVAWEVVGVHCHR
jgi:hypothetical protein